MIKNQGTHNEIAVAGEDKRDRLERIFDEQTRFSEELERVGRQRRCNVDFAKLYEGDHSELFKLEKAVGQFAQCIMMEGAELLDWTAWKHWSSQMGNKNPDVKRGSVEHVREMRVECADLLCFLVNACQALGMSAQDIYDYFMEKRQTNSKRQEGGNY